MSRNERLRELLDYLNECVDPKRQAETDNLFVRSLSYQDVPRLPMVLSYPFPPDHRFSPYPNSEIYDDPEKMLFNELASAWGTSIALHSTIGDDLPYTIRANFGTVLIASLFGARAEQVDENNPWVRPPENWAGFETILQTDPSDFSRGWCPRVPERLRFYRDYLQDWPDIAGILRIALPDLQGPLDVADQLRGSGLFLDFMDKPDVVREVLLHIAAGQVGFAHSLEPYITDGPDGFSHQHASSVRGAILIRDDSAVMISQDMYRDVVAEADEQVLSGMGGGGIHSCGRIDHQVEALFDLDSILCLDLGQPEMNDLDVIYTEARPKGISLVRMTVPEEQIRSGSVLRRFPTGVGLTFAADSPDHARAVWEDYLSASEKR